MLYAAVEAVRFGVKIRIRLDNGPYAIFHAVYQSIDSVDTMRPESTRFSISGRFFIEAQLRQIPDILAGSTVLLKHEVPLNAMALSNVIQTVPDTPLPPSRGDLRGVIQI